MLRNVKQSQEFIVNDLPVGLMTASKSGLCIEINALVTHPGSEGVGIALIEHAVNLSWDAARGGRVLLEPDSNAVGAYESIGFKTRGSGLSMLLDPTKSPDLWTPIRIQAWRLRRHADKPYVAALGSNLP